MKIGSFRRSSIPLALGVAVVGVPLDDALAQEPTWPPVLPDARAQDERGVGRLKMARRYGMTSADRRQSRGEGRRHDSEPRSDDDAGDG